MSVRSDVVMNEPLLWQRAGRAVVVSMLLFVAIGAGLMAIAVPDSSLAARIGIGLFVGFWSGPFFGTAAAVGYHELRTARDQRQATVVEVGTVQPSHHQVSKAA